MKGYTIRDPFMINKMYGKKNITERCRLEEPYSSKEKHSQMMGFTVMNE